MSYRVTPGKVTEQSSRRPEVFRQLTSAIEQASNVLVVSHLNPDGDALGTQLAFGEYLEDQGKTVTLARDSEIPNKYLFLNGIEKIIPHDDMADDLTFDTAILLECPSVSRAGKIARHLSGNVTVINIDHHGDAESYGTINWIEPGISSVGEMIYEYFLSVGYRLRRSAAESLYTAILTDTGRFRFNSTTPRTLEISAELVGTGASPRYVCDQVYFNAKPARIKLIGKVLNGVEFHDKNRICFLTLTRSMYESSQARDSDSDGIVDFTLVTGGVRAGVMFKEINEKTTKVSLRSREGINVAAVAGDLGGGGHRNAAGCTLSMPMNEAKIEILSRLKKVIVQETET